MKIMKYLACLICLALLVAAFYAPVAAVAADGTSDNTTAPAPTEPPTPPDSITLTTEFPKLEAVAAGTFQFNVSMTYKGQKERVFDLKTSAPSGWEAYIQPQYETGKRISSITIDSSFSGMSKSVTAVITSPSYPTPDPGEYKVLFTVASGNVSGSIELVAKITAKFSLSAKPANQRYNTTATAGKDNIFSLELNNLGSAQVDSLTFSSTHPEGWEIKFTPEKLDLLKTSEPKTIDVNIKPPPKTVAGDYMITLNVAGKQATAEKVDVRVTVKTPTIWGWVGVIIIVIVVAGLFVIFMRFGRR